MDAVLRWVWRGGRRLAASIAGRGEHSRLGPEVLEFPTTVYNLCKGRAETSQPGSREPTAPAPVGLPGGPQDTEYTRADTRVGAPGPPNPTHPGGPRAAKTRPLCANPYSRFLHPGAPGRLAQGKRYCVEKMRATYGEWASERIRGGWAPGEKPTYT